MKKTKNLFPYILIFSLALAGTGCSSSDGTGSIPSAEAETIEASDTSDTPETSSDKKNHDKKSSDTNSSDKASSENRSTDTSYSSMIFDTSYVHEINVEISEEDWADLKENPTAKTKYKTTVTIDGEALQEVSFATKGNTSLSSVASDKDSDRYSFKLNFGKYVDDQTYHGLDKLNLNNLYADATYMKDYISYEIFRAAGASAPLTSYVHLSINGESFGLYLAIEEVGDSFLARTEAGEGELYKPESEQLDNMGKMDGKKFPGDGNMPQMPDGMTPPDGADFPGDGNMPQMPDGSGFPGNGQLPDNMTPDSQNQQDKDSSGKGSRSGRRGNSGSNDNSDNSNTQNSGKDFKNNMPGGFGGFGSSNSGASLAYTDDNIDSYSDIFDNAETKADEEDEKRVIAALKQLSEGTDLENCLDTDAVIRYFAAHNFVLNYDSYTGNMLHNYYLYEKDGKLSMIPWDYNLAFGGFGGGGGFNKKSDNDTGSENKESRKNSFSDAASIINTGIDTPLSGATEDSRPMWAWISSNEEYLEKYHEIYDELLKNYFENGTFEKEIDRIYNMIRPYVEEDPSKFYSVDEFDKACETLKTFCLLRAESIRKQLDGSLSASTDKQDSKDQVAAGDINISDMGSQGNNKGGGMKNPMDFGEKFNREEAATEE